VTAAICVTCGPGLIRVGMLYNFMICSEMGMGGVPRNFLVLVIGGGAYNVRGRGLPYERADAPSRKDGQGDRKHECGCQTHVAKIS
jgi:hypothetical protein